MEKRHLKNKESTNIYLGTFNHKDFEIVDCDLEEVKRFGKFAYLNLRKTLEDPKNEIYYLKPF